MAIHSDRVRNLLSAEENAQFFLTGQLPTAEMLVCDCIDHALKLLRGVSDEVAAQEALD